MQAWVCWRSRKVIQFIGIVVIFWLSLQIAGVVLFIMKVNHLSFKFYANKTSIGKSYNQRDFSQTMVAKRLFTSLSSIQKNLEQTYNIRRYKNNHGFNFILQKFQVYYFEHNSGRQWGLRVIWANQEQIKIKT